jgi:hypothetical protein
LKLRKENDMPTLIRDRNATMTASLEDLNYTYRELRGEKNHPGFKDRAAAQVQVQMAIMAAEGVVGRMGVPQNTAPVAKTVKELGFNPYKEGTMSYELYEAVHKQEPIVPRIKASEATPDKPAPKRLVINKVKATFAGTSKMQSGSVRAAVLKFVQESPDNTATVEAIDAAIGQPCRGHLQKLLEKNHIAVVEGNDE